ncbi:TRAP transporter small permease [Marinobacterium aestuariivivens]|uniref:TRAP transporter small permease protein n=1 Tax=Marinobacterium aestuariivivens TaxID=1698799 RepID=A0ABW2A2S2_9GAMM
MKYVAAKATSWLDRLEKFTVVTFCGSIVILIFMGVLSRYFFHYSIAWSEELARFLFLLGALFGAASACKTGQHGGIPLLVDKFPPALQRVTEVFVGICMLVFIGYLAWQSYGTTMRALASGQTSMTTGISIWVINLGMFLAFCLAFVRTVQGLIIGAYRIDKPIVE